ncbi:hypothetical protein [Streptomyces sp. NPDC001348]
MANSAELTRDLRTLAAKPQLQRRAKELRALADDLARGQDLDVWAEIDLIRAFARPECVESPGAAAPPPPTAPGAKRANQATWKGLWDWLRKVREGPLEAALGVMVFVPLLVTWAGLRMAGEAYGELAEDDPKEASRPFLQLWQSGFDGHLSSYERFDSVALTAVGLIGFLVLLAVWHACVRARTERELADQEDERNAVLAELVSVLTRAQLLLVTHRHGSPQRFAAELTVAAGQLRSLTRQVAKSHDSLVLVAESADRAVTALSAATDRLSDEVPQLGAAADRIETAVRSGADALRDAQATAVDAVRSAQDSTTRTGQDNATAVREVGDRIVQAGTLIDTALKKLTTVQGELVTLSGQAVQATDRASQSMVSSAGRTGDAVDGMRKATERWDAAAAHWQDAAARLDEGIRRLAGNTHGVSGNGARPGAPA